MYFGRLLVTLGLIDITLSARVFGIKVCFCTLTVKIMMNFSPCSWKTIESLSPRWVFIISLTVSCKRTENPGKRDPMRFFPASYFNWRFFKNGDIVTRIGDTVTIGQLVNIFDHVLLFHSVRNYFFVNKCQTHMGIFKDVIS